MTLMEFLREVGLHPYEEDFDNADYSDYEIIIAGHPGEVGTSFEAKDISMGHNAKTIHIWVT